MSFQNSVLYYLQGKLDHSLHARARDGHAYLFYDLKEQKEHLFVISGKNSACL